MAAHPIVIVDDELLDKLPEQFKADPRYQKGAALELVPVINVRQPAVVQTTGDWRRLEGLLTVQGQPFSATNWKREQREQELAHDEQKFGTKRPAW